MVIDGAKVTGFSARSARRVPLLDLPPLGHLQALILKTLDELGTEASGLKALETLCLETSVWIDHAQVYGAIRRLEDNDLIEFVETRAQKRRGPPLKIYKVTEAGRTALKETLEHYKANIAFLEDKKKRKAART